MIVEWAQRVQSVLPDQGLWVQLNYIDDVQRDLIFSGRGPYYEDLLSRFRRLIYGGRVLLAFDTSTVYWHCHIRWHPGPLRIYMDQP